MYFSNHKTIKISGLLVSVIGLIVMFGWLAESEVITKILPSFPPMQFNTALCFFALGTASLISQNKKISCIKCILALFVIFISLSTLCEYLFNIDFGLDQFFIIQNFNDNLELHPGRMSPNTAGCFFLVSIANILSRFDKKIHILKDSQTSIFLAITILATASTIGYITNIHFLFSWGDVTGMAIHTAFCFFILCIPKIQLRIFNQKIRKVGVVISAIVYCIFFITWLYSINSENKVVKSTVLKDSEIIYNNLDKKLNLEYSAVERLNKRLALSSYSSKNAIIEDFQAYANDYPNIYFIYDKEHSKNESIFLSNYSINETDANKIILNCNNPSLINDINLICISYDDRLFYVVFKHNFSELTIDQLSYKDYNLEIFYNGSKIFSNLDKNNNYKIKIPSSFGIKDKWLINIYLTENEYEALQENFPSIYFVLGVIVSIIIQGLFYSMGINLRKNKVLTKKQNQLRKLSSEDTLTGTYNRATFNRKLNQAIDSKTDKKQLALLFIDLDDFKNINDSYGHDSGDTVLRIVATRLNYFLREKDFVARMGGDEFVIVLNNIESKKDIENIIGRILELFKDPIKLTKDRTITQTVSIGVAISPKDCHTKADELLVQADIAMYKAKNAGKNSYQFFDKEND